MRSTSTRTRSLLLTGRANAAPAPLELAAGPVTALLDGADLRHIRVGDVELVQRVYVALRDAAWNTIPAVFMDRDVQRGPDRFRVSFMARHVHEEIDFAWRGRIEGRPDGTIRYEMDGECRSSFRYSKIGFNVHHGLVGAVGRPYRAATASGELWGTLPAAIDPQRIVGTTLTGMFDPYHSIAIEVVDGLEAVVALEGDLLELQDHRNWTDSNFKSYGTPLALGFPFDAAPGQRLHQELTVGYRGTVPTPAVPRPPTIVIGPATGRTLPAIGLGTASHGDPLGPREAELLAACRPAHLRVDLELRDEGHLAELSRAAGDARAVGAGLELALFASDGSGPALEQLADAIRDIAVPVARVLVYHSAEGFSALGGVTPASVVALVKSHLEPITGSVVFAGGTNQSFSDLNRDRPSDPLLTGLCFSICPTVHAADDASIIENLASQADVVAMARAIGGERAICVSPVTIASRFGPYPAGPTSPGDLPAPVDVRQASLLGAVWTTGSLRYLAEADSVTFYETTGWRGIMERDTASPDSRFPSRPGDVFPVYHVLATAGEWREGRVLTTESSEPLTAEALAVELADGVHCLLANLHGGPATIVVAGLPAGSVRVRALDAAGAPRAMSSPGGYRTDPGTVAEVIDGSVAIALDGYAVARLDPA